MTSSSELQAMAWVAAELCREITSVRSIMQHTFSRSLRSVVTLRNTFGTHRGIPNSKPRHHPSSHSFLPKKIPDRILF